MVAGFLLKAVLALHRLAADPAAELLGKSLSLTRGVGSESRMWGT
jgi:hypothetical protein